MPCELKGEIMNEIIGTVLAFIGLFAVGVGVTFGALVLYHKIKGDL